MVAILDTNHFREFVEASASGRRLLRRIEKEGADVFVCIVGVEESVQGWLALLNKRQAGRDQLLVYSRFQRDTEALLKFAILPFDEEAVNHFERLRVEHPRLGSMDLKIASICLAHDATLLSRNLRDFEKVPGLRTENWLD